VRNKSSKVGSLLKIPYKTIHFLISVMIFMVEKKRNFALQNFEIYER